MSREIDAMMAAVGPIAGARALAPRLSGGIAALVLDVGGLSAAARAAMAADTEAALLALPFVDTARIALTADRPVRTMIAVASGKGGVGKSTLAANLAVALARQGVRTGLIDADIYGPSQPSLMGNRARPEAVGKQIVPIETHGVRMLSIGQLVEPGVALAWRGPMAASALGQLVDGDWGDTETILVDLPPGTGDVQLSLLQKWKPAGALIVSTPQDLALIDAARAIDLFRKMDLPILGLVENMAGYACPQCGAVSQPFGSGGAEKEAARLGISFLGRVPLTLALREAADAGVPLAAGDGAEARLFDAIAARLLAAVNQAAP